MNTKNSCNLIFKSLANLDLLIFFVHIKSVLENEREGRGKGGGGNVLFIIRI